MMSKMISSGTFVFQFLDIETMIATSIVDPGAGPNTCAQVTPDLFRLRAMISTDR